MVEELWMWCMNSEITIIVEHLPGILNTIADEESRLIKAQVRLDADIQEIPTEIRATGGGRICLSTQLERFFS